jgi:ribosome biogenesis GTPase / thiamine phosphate phosphatase
VSEGCAVLVALNKGSHSQERFQNYSKIKKESSFYEMSYLEKRRKDKKLGRFYNKVMKEKVRNKRW